MNAACEAIPDDCVITLLHPPLPILRRRVASVRRALEILEEELTGEYDDVLRSLAGPGIPLDQIVRIPEETDLELVAFDITVALELLAKAYEAELRRGEWFACDSARNQTEKGGTER